MGETSIQWTDKTWNPTRGCSRVSEGCRNCYAERQAARFAAPAMGVLGERGAIPCEQPAAYKAGPFNGFVTKVNGHPAWTGKVELVDSKLCEPLTWRKPVRVFVNSMSDLFHAELTLTDIEKVFRIMCSADRHTFQILTKRADLMAWRVPIVMNRIFGMHWQMPQNIWLGVSVEDQKTADERIPFLLRTPSAIRFVSYEPALGPVDFDSDSADGLHALGCGDDEHKDKEECLGLDWVIVGGESGPGSRPFDIQWARDTVAQCAEANVACFVKQLGTKPYNSLDGAYPRIPLKDRKGGDMAEWPIGLRVREFPA